jgi:hypothetical protein
MFIRRIALGGRQRLKPTAASSIEGWLVRVLAHEDDGRVWNSSCGFTAYTPSPRLSDDIIDFVRF